MPSEIIRGPTYRISIEMAYLPQATVEWWKKLIRLTKNSFERPDWMKMLLDYIQSAEAEKAYAKLIPSSKLLYRRAHGSYCTVPSQGQLNLFHKRLPTVVQLLKTEIEKYERRN